MRTPARIMFVAAVLAAGVIVSCPAMADEGPVAWTPGDFDRDRDVDFEDLLLLLGLWGHEFSVADLDRDGVVGFPDLVILLRNWT